MQTLILNDGTELENSYAAESIDYLFLYISNGMNLMQVMMLMVDPGKINRIVYAAGDQRTEYNDYTTVTSITAEHGGMISVSLRRNT